MKKHFWMVAVVFMVTQMAFAVPAKKGSTKTVTLTDGTKVEISLKGDEYGHWWTDAQGNNYSVDNREVATLLSAADMETLQASRLEMMNLRNALRETTLKKISQKKAEYSGTKHGIVILVNFQDLEMKSETAQEDFYRMFNEDGYSDGGHIGSVAEYFRDQSYGELNIEFDVAGPVTVAHDMAYYGGNDRSGNDSHPCEMVIEACELINDSIDFSLYDWDGDGEVDQVFVVYAGYGENAGAPSNTIWPHEWELSSGYYYGDGTGAQTLDGVKVDTYAVSCELAGTKGSTLAGMGTACHEFSHCMGYPDFYDTNYSGGWGMQAWDLLDGGCYNGPSYNGEVPCGYTSYERWVAGWVEPTVLKDSMQVSNMQPLNDTPEAYVLYNEGNSNEYYLLENRRADRWFKYVEDFSASSGMLIIHVDYDANAWRNNTPNSNASHQRMTIFRANNEDGSFRGGYYYFTQAEYQGHLYPSGENDSLTVNSTPAATLYNNNSDGTKYMDKGIWDITLYDDNTMSFNCYSEYPSDENLDDDDDENLDDGDKNLDDDDDENLDDDDDENLDDDEQGGLDDGDENPDDDDENLDDDEGLDDGEDTGIVGVPYSSDSSSPKRIYNMSGQYVGTDFHSLEKGIYVVDGQKIVKR